MSAPTCDVHPSWDAEKVHAHLADLDHERRVASDVYERLSDLADESRREAQRKAEQIEHCCELFSKPRKGMGTDA